MKPFTSFYRLFGIAIAALIIFLIASSIIYRQRNEKLNFELKNGRTQISDSFVKLFEGLTASSFRYSGTAVPKNLKVVPEDGIARDLKEVVLKHRKVILFSFSETHCGSCWEAELEKIKKLKQTKNALYDKIIVISKYTNNRHLTILKDLKKIDFEIYNIQGEMLLNDLNMPFYFLLDSDFIYKDFFIPIKELPNLTDQYFEAMSTKNFGISY